MQNKELAYSNPVVTLSTRLNISLGELTTGILHVTLKPCYDQSQTVLDSPADLPYPDKYDGCSCTR